MNIYRRGRTGYDWSKTDSKEPDDFSESWVSNQIVTLDGTIDKAGERHTEIGLELEDDDVVSLFNALIDKYRSEIVELREKLFSANKESRLRREALEKIHDLISYHSDEAPSLNSLIGAVQTIANHFDGLQVNETAPTLKWIKWEKIHGDYFFGEIYSKKEFS